VELRLRLMEQILRFVRAEEYQELLLDAVESYYKLSGRERKAEEQLVRSGRYGEVKQVAQTVLERREARAQLETMRHAVQQAILTRFPEAPPELLARVERQRSVRALEALHRQAILAPDLAELEAQWPE
jgi:hypothetical protein